MTWQGRWGCAAHLLGLDGQHHSLCNVFSLQHSDDMKLAAAEALSQRKSDCFVCSNISAAQPAAESCFEEVYPTWIMRSGLPMPSVILVRTMPTCTATLQRFRTQHRSRAV